MSKIMEKININAVYAILLVCFLIFVFGASLYIAYNSDFSEKNELYAFMSSLKDRINSYGALAPLVYLLVLIIGTCLLFPTVLLQIIASALFSPFEAIFLTLAGSLLGATSAFFIARTSLQNFVHKRIEQRYIKYSDLLGNMGFNVVLFLRVVPIIPFEVFNYLAGVTKITIKDYFLATFIGLIPGTLISILFFSSIFDVIMKTELQLSAFANFKMGMFFGLYMVMIIVPLVFLYIRARKMLTR
ncbi:MAG: VTT domain-containing protein [Candidatus Woesearchaeota archaeon]